MEILVSYTISSLVLNLSLIRVHISDQLGTSSILHLLIVSNPNESWEPQVNSFLRVNYPHLTSQTWTTNQSSGASELSKRW
jgi:hypothetical protein